MDRQVKLHYGGIIVAAYGMRVHSFAHYDYARNSSENPELILIVWQRGAYRELRASPPGYRFGGDFGTYSRK